MCFESKIWHRNDIKTPLKSTGDPKFELSMFEVMRGSLHYSQSNELHQSSARKCYSVGHHVNLLFLSSKYNFRLKTFPRGSEVNMTNYLYIDLPYANHVRGNVGGESKDLCISRRGKFFYYCFSVYSVE